MSPPERLLVAYKVFKNKFVEGTHTEQQVDLCYDFLFTLERCVAQGANNLWSLNLDPGDTKVAVLLKRLEHLMEYQPSSKKYKGSSKVLRASIGSAVEEQAYYLLGQEYDVEEDETGDYALELAGKSGDLFPHSFTGKRGKKGSRPDVRLALGNGFEALYDITAGTGNSSGHILDKAGSWMTRANVPFITEVYYTENHLLGGT